MEEYNSISKGVVFFATMILLGATTEKQKRKEW